MASGGYSSETARRLNLGALTLPATAFTRTYNVAGTTIPNATYAAVTIGTEATSVAKTNSSPYGFSSSDADKVVTFCAAVPTDLAALNTALAALAVDVILLKKLIVQINADLVTCGIES